MTIALPSLPSLAVPEAEIMRQAEGSTTAALRLAAAWGYAVACRDLDAVMGGETPPQEARS